MTYCYTTRLKSLIFALLCLPLALWAQPKDNSPYSRFGIGDLVSLNFKASEQMGGLGASFIDQFNINIVNPAALSYLSTATFDVGLHAEYSKLQDRENRSVGLWNGNIDYLSLAFPLQNQLNDILDRKERNINLGMAFTLMPYSTVGYDISSFFFDENFGQYEVNYEGSGGTYQVAWSNGIRYKDLAFGLNLGYLFGKINNITTVNFTDVDAAYNTFLDRNTNMSGFLWRAGLMYTLTLNKAQQEDEQSPQYKRLTFGLHANSTTGLNTSSNVFEAGVLILPDGSTVLDTFQNVSGESIKGTLPSQIGMGVSYTSGNKFSLGINYEATQWSKFSSAYVNNNLKNTYNLSFGGFYRPNYNSITNYFSRVYYRFGAYYRKVPVEISQGDDIDDIGLNIGFGMPFFYQRKISHANLGVNLGLRGRGTAIEERYVRFTFSFTFNDDEWFIKRKYN
ncbi:MAG: hypothetical protein HKN09_14035 [Saprospiraceae bacterium]|nr:hypothetical protein [Saprospiraceae bacterium]